MSTIGLSDVVTRDALLPQAHQVIVVAASEGQSCHTVKKQSSDTKPQDSCAIHTLTPAKIEIGETVRNHLIKAVFEKIQFNQQR